MTTTSELPRRLLRVAGINQTFLRQTVHLRFVGGKENIGGRAGLDLPRQRAGRAKIENDFVAGGPFVSGGDLLQADRSGWPLQKP